MDNVELRKRVMDIFADILRRITDRYVMDELTIPGSVLALKDEACGIAEKAAQERNADILGEYERRLIEIRESVASSGKG